MTPTKKPHKGGPVPTYAERVASGQRRLEVWLCLEDYETVLRCAAEDCDGSKVEAVRAMIALYRGVKEEEKSQGKK